MDRNDNNGNNNNNRNNNNNNMSRGINNIHNSMNTSRDDENGNRNEIDDNVNGGDDDLLYVRDNNRRIVQTNDGSNYALKQIEYQETVDMDKTDQNLLEVDSANGIHGIPEFNNNAFLSSEDQDDDDLNKIINSVTGVRNNNMYISNCKQEEDSNDIMSNSGTQRNKAGNSPVVSDILHRILGSNEAKVKQRTALDGVREYENESDSESKTVLQNDGPISSPAPTNINTTSLTGRAKIPSFNEGITPTPGVPNDLCGDSCQEYSFGAVGPMHYARQRSGGIEYKGIIKVYL